MRDVYIETFEKIKKSAGNQIWIKFSEENR